MKNLLLLAFFILTATVTCCAQDSKKPKEPIKRELGIKMSSFDSFSLLYKKERKPNKYFRLDFSSASIQATDEHFLLGVGIGIGYEKRKSITEDLTFLSGFRPSLSFQLRSIRDVHITDVSARIGYILGFQYEINDHFNLAIETIPSISQQFAFSNAEISENGLDLSIRFTSQVGLTILYKFVK